MAHCDLLRRRFLARQELDKPTQKIAEGIQFKLLVREDSAQY
jgi:hypothetical protein